MKKKTVYAGEKFTIVPVAMFKNGVVVGSKNSKDGIKSGELKYKSSNTSIATVNAKGVVTVKKKGKCKITVTSIYDSQVKGTLSLTVSKGKQKAKITLKEKKASIVVGKTTTIKVKSFKGISNKNIAFSSSDKKSCNGIIQRKSNRQESRKGNDHCNFPNQQESKSCV